MLNDNRNRNWNVVTSIQYDIKYIYLQFKIQCHHNIYVYYICNRYFTSGHGTFSSAVDEPDGYYYYHLKQIY